ncbi:MAG: twin-arginine translocase subunit TatC [Bdellovibrionales bacterium]
MTVDEQQMSLVEHLTELRTRLIRALLGVAVGIGASLFYAPQIFTLIRKPIQPFLGKDGGLVFTGPMDSFLAHIKVGVLSGIILTCPFWLYQIWMFVSPGLYKNERKYAAAFISAGSLLFLAGVMFVYYFVYPTAFEYLLSFGSDLKPMITIDAYLGFFVMTTLMFGIAFELPLALVLLAMMGIIDAAFLRKQRRYAIVVLALAAAILTPPDVISMSMLLVPLVLFYEASIWIIQIVVRKREQQTSLVPHGEN